MATWTDLPNEFLTHPTSGELVLKNNDLAVRQSLRNLISIDFLEKPFHPEICLMLKRMLFEPLTPFLLTTLERNLITILGKLEPRAQIIQLSISSPEDSGGVILTVFYRLINSSTTQTIDLYFDRIR